MQHANESTCHCAASAKLSPTSMERRLWVQPCRVYLEQIQAFGLRINILSILSIAIMNVSLEYYSKWDIISEKAEQKVNGCHLSFHHWQPIFSKCFQCGPINLQHGRVLPIAEEETWWAGEGVNGERNSMKKTNAAWVDISRKWCKVRVTLCRWLTMNRRSSKPLSRNLLSYCGSPTCSSHSPTGWSRALPQAPSAERGKRFSREKPFSR